MDWLGYESYVFFYYFKNVFLVNKVYFRWKKINSLEELVFYFNFVLLKIGKIVLVLLVLFCVVFCILSENIVLFILVYMWVKIGFDKYILVYCKYK